MIVFFANRTAARTFKAEETAKGNTAKLIDNGADSEKGKRWAVELVAVEIATDAKTEESNSITEFADHLDAMEPKKEKIKVSSFADLAALDIQAKACNTLSIGRKSSGMKTQTATQHRFNKIKKVSVIIKKSRKNVLTCAA